MGLLSFLFGSKPTVTQQTAQQMQPQQPPPQGLLSVPKGTDQQSYQDYAEMAMTKGQQPLPFAVWMKQRQMQQQAPVPAK